MKIIVLDGYVLNPGDLSWNDLNEFGDCIIYNRTPDDEIIKRAQDAEIVLTNKTVLSKEVIDQLPKLKYIGVLATGYNVVNIDSARDRGIPVTNIPAYGTQSVAQMVFAHILNLTQHVAQHSEGIKAGKWAQSLDFCYWDYPLIELSGLVLGIVGFGRIGLETAKLGLAFGMKVIVYDAYPTSSPPEGINLVNFEFLLKNSDFISLHCPLIPETKNLINKERLALMKPSAFLINTSRGQLVDEQALAESLDTNKIAGAGLDVLTKEPPEADNPIYKARNCYITPHIAWATKSSRSRLMNIAIDNLKAFLSGHIQNQVNI